MRRIAVGIVLLMVLTDSVANAVDVAPPLETRITEALERPFLANWRDVELRQVCGDLAAAVGVPLVIDELALQDEGIDLSQQVTLELGRVPVSQAFRFLLRPNAIELICRDDDLQLTSHAVADGWMTTHVYDVRALSDLLRDRLLEHPRFQVWGCPGASMGGFMQFGGGAGGLGSSSQGILVESYSPRDRVEMTLAMLIQGTTSGQWGDIDGVGGTMTLGRGRLFVRQTQRVHFEIAGLLNTLELLAGGKIKAKVLPAPPRPNYPGNADLDLARTLLQPSRLVAQAEPLRDVVQKLCAEAGASLWIDATALEDEGVDPTTPVTFDAAGRPVKTVFSDALDPLELTVLIEEGRLVVTTKAVADEPLSVRLYRVDDLDEADDAGRLWEVLSNQTAGFWDDVDGIGGTALQLTRDLLVVRQSQRVHAEIDRLFEALRSLPRASDGPAQPATPEFEQRLYGARDASLLRDVEQLLPELFGGKDAWPVGSLRRVGDRAVLIRQTKARHADVEAFFSALEALHQRLEPTPHTPPAAETPKK